MPIDRSQASALCVRPFTPAPAALAIRDCLRRDADPLRGPSCVTTGPLPLVRMRRPVRSPNAVKAHHSLKRETRRHRPRQVCGEAVAARRGSSQAAARAVRLRFAWWGDVARARLSARVGVVVILGGLVSGSALHHGLFAKAARGR